LPDSDRAIARSIHVAEEGQAEDFFGWASYMEWIGEARSPLQGASPLREAGEGKVGSGANWKYDNGIHAIACRELSCNRRFQVYPLE
jgi:hypothetical protein